ncbi:hypothetical protein DFR52_106222 [Hoeflea marina]|uniref:Tail assembly chaperone E/41/14-like protein n=1 Tax=Hoeflea marina TaxID=274592 RepID=A0A317PJC4_9HYPH|nr:phage tail assembly protein [Hoeflea marina]PWV97697.1 hypothetical protein DFR52_106222 [Hoeflea marina]
MTKPSDTHVAISDIPLPPEDQWEGLENQPDSKSAPSQSRTEVKRAPVEPAKLDFIGTGHFLTIPLKHPFHHPETGKPVTEITIRRLLTSEMEDAIAGALDGEFSNFILYARMTGLSVPILRGLIDEDGARVTDAAYDFLPPVFRAESGS